MKSNDLTFIGLWPPACPVLNSSNLGRLLGFYRCLLNLLIVFAVPQKEKFQV